jgi:hypothetical protein
MLSCAHICKTCSIHRNPTHCTRTRAHLRDSKIGWLKSRITQRSHVEANIFRNVSQQMIMLNPTLCCFLLRCLCVRSHLYTCVMRSALLPVLQPRPRFFPFRGGNPNCTRLLSNTRQGWSLLVWWVAGGSASEARTRCRFWQPMQTHV